MSTGKASVLGAGSFREPELTPAASETLDRNVASIRQQILRELAREYRDPDHRIRTSDVESAVNSISAFATSRIRASSRITKLAIFLAAVCLAGQIVILISGSRETWLISAVAAMAGATAGTAFVLVMQDVRRRRRRSRTSLHEFLRAFDALEDDVRRHARELLGDSADIAGLGRAISAVELMQLWTPEDSQEFRRVLAMRNSIVHEDSHQFSANDIATAFSQMARLTSLLDGGSEVSAKGKLADLTENRAARVFEDRVANALRRAGFSVSVAQGEPDYDLLAEKSGTLKKVAVKYRKSGLLTVQDVADIAEKAEPGAATIVITNVPVSPYTFSYLELSANTRGTISIMTWPDVSNPEPLVDAVTAAAAGAA